MSDLNTRVSTMIELKTYTKAELAEILHTTARQGITRKLDRYSITYTCDGDGDDLRITIKAIPDPFKVFCITELGIPAQADFTKLRNLFYYLFCCEGFAGLPLIQMAERMDEDGRHLSRETIGKWLNYLQGIDYVAFDKTDCIYYAISPATDGRKLHREISKGQYNTGWKIYFEKKPEEGSHGAYAKMYSYIGGHPYKKAKMIPNAFYIPQINQLIDIINDSFNT